MKLPARRTVAATVGLLLVIVGSAAIAWLAGRRQGVARPDLPHAAPVFGREAYRPDGRPSVLMYVDETCPFCKGELATWARFAESDSAAANVAVVLVSRRPPTFDSRLVPPGLTVEQVVDSSGAIGRALGVRRIPFVAYIDAHGVVRSRTSGLTGIDQIRDHVLALTERPPENEP